MTFKIEGYGEATYYSDGEIRHYEEILKKRRAEARDLRLRTEAWINTLPARMQLIVQMKYIENETWEMVARKIGKGATPDGLRVEFQRFMGTDWTGKK